MEKTDVRAIAAELGLINAAKPDSQDICFVPQGHYSNIVNKVKPDAALIARLLAEPDPEPDDLEAMDAAWEEEEVLFGPGAAADACGKGGLSAKLRQAGRPAPGLEPAPGAGPRTVFTTSQAPRA